MRFRAWTPKRSKGRFKNKRKRKNVGGTEKLLFFLVIDFII